MRAISISQPGDSDVLTLGDVPMPDVTPGSLRVAVLASGVNFLDLYFRRGTYPHPLPFVPGVEGVGIVREVADDVSGFAVGDRVAWSGGMGSYAEFAVVPAATTALLPDGVDDEAGLVIAQGLTAHYLAHDIRSVGPGTTALVHAAAGGVGLLLTQILKIRGARVIGAVSSPSKFEPVRRAGADEVIASSGDWTKAVRDLTDGTGVDIVYDGIGAPTFEGSIAALNRRGTMVMYGCSGGAVDTISVGALMRAGSITFIRPGLADYIATRAIFEERMDDLFRWIGEGTLKVEICARYPLEMAAEAQRVLESRQAVGKIILVSRSRDEAI